MLGSRSIRLFATGLVPAVAMLISACSGGKDALVPVGETQPKPADSVYRESSPQPRSQDLAAELDALRRQTYLILPADAPAPQGAFPPAVAPGFVPHDDVPYTEAYRHAVYLNGVNSSAWLYSNPAGADTKLINSASEYAELLLESVIAPADGAYPALFTGPNLFQRIEAVRGGRDVLAAGSCRASTVYETYVFNGNVEKPDGTVSFFRGYDSTRGTIDPLLNAWYQRRGRMLLARASLRYFGYGQKCDDSRVDCSHVPYPILDGQFLGVLTALHSFPVVAQFGWWPNNGNTDVIPYGVDTDIGGPEQYAGTPIHITLPISQPIPRITGFRSLSFTRVDANGVPTAPSVAPSSTLAYQQFKVFTNVFGLVVPTIATPANGQFRAAGPIAALLSNISVLSVTNNLYLPNLLAQFTTFTVDAATDLSQVNVGDILVIKIKAGTKVGTYRYAITAVNNNLKTVTVLIPSQTFTPLGPLNPAFPGEAYADDAEANLKLDFESVSSQLVSAIIDKNLLDGEVVLVPVAPLQNNTSYRVSFQIVTPAFNSGVQTFTFTTNDKGIYP